MKIDGKQIAEEILNNLKTKIQSSKSANQPSMAVILNGDNPASLSYIKQKQKACEKIGVNFIFKEFPIAFSQLELVDEIEKFNNDILVNGIIIQRPLPAHIEAAEIDQAVAPDKDIDGLNPHSKFTPPIALAVLKALETCYTVIKKQKSTEIENSRFVNWLSNQKIVLLGRGETGGKPIRNTLTKLKLKFIQTHSKTENLKEILKQADIIISAVGKSGLITGNMIKKGATCIGVGISKDQNSHLIGDFDEDSISQIANFYTPTPGGIGPLNVAFLLDNLVKSWDN